MLTIKAAHLRDNYLFALDTVDRRIEALEVDIGEVAATCSYAGLISKLRCLKGVNTLTALGLVAEVGDFNRFDSAQQFMSFLGLVPSEHSSGQKRRQGSITKVGNRHARRLLVESAWSYRHRPKASYEIGIRQQGQDPKTVERAWIAQRRLHARFNRMNGRGKTKQKTVTAVARELAGFVWAIATDQPLRKEELSTN